MDSTTRKTQSHNLRNQTRHGLRRMVTERPAPGPSEVQFLLLGGFARSENRRLSWDLDETGGEISF